MDYRDIITIDPEKRSGKPCIRGLRITVCDVLEFLAGGMSFDEVISDFPELTIEDIRACLAFVADSERNDWRNVVNDKAALLNRITIEPGKCGGRPCVRSTRMRVVDVLQLLSSGADHAEILRDYPSLEEADILACLEYAARQTDHIILHPA